jgi:hypothetical protein
MNKKLISVLLPLLLIIASSLDVLFNVKANRAITIEHIHDVGNYTGEQTYALAQTPVIETEETIINDENALKNPLPSFTFDIKDSAFKNITGPTNFKEDNYEISYEENYATVVLKSNYVNNLSLGKYEFKFVTDGGEVPFYFIKSYSGWYGKEQIDFELKSDEGVFVPISSTKIYDKTIDLNEGGILTFSIDEVNKWYNDAKVSSDSVIYIEILNNNNKGIGLIWRCNYSENSANQNKSYFTPIIVGDSTWVDPGNHPKDIFPILEKKHTVSFVRNTNGTFSFMADGKLEMKLSGVFETEDFSNVTVSVRNGYDCPKMTLYGITKGTGQIYGTPKLKDASLKIYNKETQTDGASIEMELNSNIVESVEGNEIEAKDYMVEGNTLKINHNYLAALNPDVYTFKIKMKITREEIYFRLKIKNTKDEPKINGDNTLFFEPSCNDDLLYSITIGNGNFISLTGNNITNNDYVFENGNLTIKNVFLKTLSNGINEFDFATDGGVLKVKVLKSQNVNDYGIINGNSSLTDFNNKTTVTGLDSIIMLNDKIDLTYGKTLNFEITNINGYYMSGLSNTKNTQILFTFFDDVAKIGIRVIYIPNRPDSVTAVYYGLCRVQIVQGESISNLTVLLSSDLILLTPEVIGNHKISLALSKTGQILIIADGKDSNLIEKTNNIFGDCDLTNMNLFVQVKADTYDDIIYTLSPIESFNDITVEGFDINKQEKITPIPSESGCGSFLFNTWQIIPILIILGVLILFNNSKEKID